MKILRDDYGLTVPRVVENYLAQQEVAGHRIHRAATGQPLVEYLESIGVVYERVAHLLEPDSRIKVGISFPQLLRLPAREIGRFLANQLSVLFDLQEMILDHETQVGFNRHGRLHLEVVTGRIAKILSTANTKAEQYALLIKEAYIAGYLHDAGNIIARRHHSYFSAYLLGLLFTDIECDSNTLASFQRVVEAVVFHEEEACEGLVTIERLHPVTLSLIIADKSDVSFQRVSSRSNVPEAVNDLHVLLNLLAAQSKIMYRNKRVTWEIAFSPRVTLEQTSLFPELLKHTQRVWVPQEWQQLYRQHNIEYVLIFQAKFFRIYFPRLALAIRALFALSSNITTFELTINDEERDIILSRLFHRHDYERKILLIERNLFKNP